MHLGIPRALHPWGWGMGRTLGEPLEANSSHRVSSWMNELAEWRLFTYMQFIGYLLSQTIQYCCPLDERRNLRTFCFIDGSNGVFYSHLPASLDLWWRTTSQLRGASISSNLKRTRRSDIGRYEDTFRGSAVALQVSRWGRQKAERRLLFTYPACSSRIRSFSVKVARHLKRSCC